MSNGVDVGGLRLIDALGQSRESRAIFVWTNDDVPVDGMTGALDGGKRGRSVKDGDSAQYGFLNR